MIILEPIWNAAEIARIEREYHTRLSWFGEDGWSFLSPGGYFLSLGAETLDEVEACFREMAGGEALRRMEPGGGA